MKPGNWTIAKFYRLRPVISLNYYPGFFTEAFPEQNLGGYTVFFDEEDARPIASPGENPSILHRKEEMLRPDDPHQAKFQALTKQAEDFGLYDYDYKIYGKKQTWEDIMRKQGVRLDGHRLLPTGTRARR